MRKLRLNVSFRIFILALSCHVISGNQGSICPASWVDCGNGKCVNSLWRCDGENDCGNLKDEEDCEISLPPGSCGPYSWDCGNGKCVSYSWRCDGVDNCGNQKDEENCESPPPRSCLRNMIRCLDSGRCIPQHWRCDGDQDCQDNSDELGCDNQCSGFRCKTQFCIPQARRCDGRIDCSDHSDEDGCPKGYGVTTPNWNSISPSSPLPVTVFQTNFASNNEENKNVDTNVRSFGTHGTLAIIIASIALIAVVGMMIYFRQFLMKNIANSGITHPVPKKNTEENV